MHSCISFFFCFPICLNVSSLVLRSKIILFRKSTFPTFYDMSILLLISVSDFLTFKQIVYFLFVLNR